MSLTETYPMLLTAVAPGRWTTTAAPKWRNPGGRLLDTSEQLAWYREMGRSPSE